MPRREESVRLEAVSSSQGKVEELPTHSSPATDLLHQTFVFSFMQFLNHCFSIKHFFVHTKEYVY